VRILNRQHALAMILLLCLIEVLLGWWTQRPWLVACAAVAGCWPMLRLTASRAPSKTASVPGKSPSPGKPTVAKVRAYVDPTDSDGLVSQMLAEGRFALLLRSRIAQGLSEAQFRQALDVLHETMGLVPDGAVIVDPTDGAAASHQQALTDMPAGANDLAAGDEQPLRVLGVAGRVVQVQRCFLDRYPVTNAQYAAFVAAGGYEQTGLWDETIWPAVLEMVDATGRPGPRFWRDGTYPEGMDDHPVVGVSWYEAAAYARWVGKRLPSDAEWVKAAAWPVPQPSGLPSQRRYPWGHSMDRAKAHLWGSEPRGTIAVDRLPEGASVGGIDQLIGNVWEWTRGNFQGGLYQPGELLLPTPMKSIRGGAFDTYFDNQATCQFQSGENPLGRRHNIGFRLAVGVCDLTLVHPTHAQGQATASSSDVRQGHAAAVEVNA